MTTRFRNPWIDPRVLYLRPADAEAYLRTRGWREVDSPSPHWKRFLSPPDEVSEAVLVPVALDDDALINLLVECVGKVASHEGRYAGDLLSELLATPARTNGVPALNARH